MLYTAVHKHYGLFALAVVFDLLAAHFADKVLLVGVIKIDIVTALNDNLAEH